MVQAHHKQVRRTHVGVPQLLAGRAQPGGGAHALRGPARPPRPLPTAHPPRAPPAPHRARPLATPSPPVHARRTHARDTSDHTPPPHTVRLPLPRPRPPPHTHPLGCERCHPVQGGCAGRRGGGHARAAHHAVRVALHADAGRAARRGALQAPDSAHPVTRAITRRMRALISRPPQAPLGGAGRAAPRHRPTAAATAAARLRPPCFPGPPPSLRRPAL